MDGSEGIGSQLALLTGQNDATGGAAFKPFRHSQGRHLPTGTPRYLALVTSVAPPPVGQPGPELEPLRWLLEALQRGPLAAAVASSALGTFGTCGTSGKYCTCPLYTGYWPLAASVGRPTSAAAPPDLGSFASILILHASGQTVGARSDDSRIHLNAARARLLDSQLVRSTVCTFVCIEQSGRTASKRKVLGTCCHYEREATKGVMREKKKPAQYAAYGVLCALHTQPPPRRGKRTACNGDFFSTTQALDRDMTSPAVSLHILTTILPNSNWPLDPKGQYVWSGRPVPDRSAIRNQHRAAGRCRRCNAAPPGEFRQSSGPVTPPGGPRYLAMAPLAGGQAGTPMEGCKYCGYVPLLCEPAIRGSALKAIFSLLFSASSFLILSFAELLQTSPPLPPSLGFCQCSSALSTQRICWRRAKPHAALPRPWPLAVSILRVITRLSTGHKARRTDRNTVSR
ncbi:hypothetical protein TARUN_9637 [Trichoderma arundinaceum]|uniref:Uncharacterized protein n=1 Tax=Trichoderma arundinaceum TaxID=490622 RepID=A0A395N932_TRIAR|nr:hypothetical protein TARUN_9637 [Trichoderma arundinaceum]